LGRSGTNLPCVLRATADFVYVRMHGPDHHHLYLTRKIDKLTVELHNRLLDKPAR